MNRIIIVKKFWTTFFSKSKSQLRKNREKIRNPKLIGERYMVGYIIAEWLQYISLDK